MKTLADNVNTIIALIGFWCMEVGVATYSLAVAWILGGALLMLVGTWPYLVQTLRKRG